MVLTKAFPFDIKADAENLGRFSGRASVYGVKDYYGDVVMPGAFTKTLEDNAGRIVVLNQHNPTDPIGTADLKDSDMALLAEGQLVLDLQSAKDMFTRVQHGLVTGISIGYETIKEAYVQGTRQLQEIRLMEISLCTFPANQFARVTDVKGVVAQLVGAGAVSDDLAQQLLQILDVVPHVKAGRVLSAANRQKIASAHDAAEALRIALKELLDATDPEPDKAHPELQPAATQLLTTMRSVRAAAKE